MGGWGGWGGLYTPNLGRHCPGQTIYLPPQKISSGMHTPPQQRGRYASYWNAFLFIRMFHLNKNEFQSNANRPLFGGHQSFLWGPLIPLFWTSGNVCLARVSKPLVPTCFVAAYGFPSMPLFHVNTTTRTDELNDARKLHW